MKQCIIYFATVVEESEGQRWPRIGGKEAEPIWVEGQKGQKAMGKAPEWCCKDLEAAIGNHNLSIGSENIRDSKSCAKYSFCPFCGAEIVYKPHLKLRVVVTRVEYEGYHYEVVK